MAASTVPEIPMRSFRSPESLQRFHLDLLRRPQPFRPAPLSVSVVIASGPWLNGKP